MRKKATPPEEYLISVNEYSKKKNVSVISIYNSIRKGYVKWERHNNTLFIDTREPDNTPKRGRKAKINSL